MGLFIANVICRATAENAHPILTDLPTAPTTGLKFCIQTCNARSNSITHFDGPITTSNFYKLMDASSDRISPLVQWLNEHQWIEIHETGTDRLLQLHLLSIRQFLYRLLPVDQCIIWHQKVGEFLQQKSRLRPEDRLQILHHLSFLGESSETNVQRVALVKVVTSQRRLLLVVHYIEALNQEWLNDDTRLTMTQMLIEAYIHTDAQTKAVETIKLLLEESTVPSTVQTELQLQLFILTNSFELIDRDDDSVDLLLNDISSEKGLLREAALLRAVQRLYCHNIKEAKTLFTKLLQSNHADSVHEQATIGLAFVKRE